MDILCKKILLLAFMLSIGAALHAQAKVSKTLTETYALTHSGKLELENKYGHITLNGWDKDEVTIEVHIMVNHRKKEVADELLQRINPIFRESHNFVAVRYEISEKSDNWFRNFFEKANPFDYDRSNIQIDYTINLPRKAELKLKNTFGDIIIEDWTGKLSVLAEHGDVWLNDDLNKADIEMRYGKLRAKNISYGSLELRNSGLDMQDATSLRINSAGSELLLENINSLELYSNKDEISVEEVGNLYGTLRFTRLQVNRLKKSVDMNMKIADFSVTGVFDANADIAIEQESSEISLDITDFSHRFTATIEQGLVRLPKSYRDIKSKMLDKSKKLREIAASYGKGLNGKIAVTGKKGVVLLKEH